LLVPVVDPINWSKHYVAQARGALDFFTPFGETPSIAASHKKSAAFDLLVNS
jgi:hypothetical protein